MFIALATYIIVDNYSGQKEEEVKSMMDLSFTPTEQTAAAPVPVNTTLVSIRLDGREDMHLPALLSNETDVYSNGIGGVNWGLSHTATGTEKRGILENGLFFITEELLIESGMTQYAEIKCEKTGWAPMPLKKERWSTGVVYTFQM
ncbi:MAG: hypothetical protein PWQ35_459 [Patescibacteria group bacterium]|nr:hypothetical protein [Patescibacteria group bacterium]